MFRLIETTTGRILAEVATMQEIRAYLKRHYTRFYCIVDTVKQVQVNYFGKEL
jgi:hypothetical protein